MIKFSEPSGGFGVGVDQDSIVLANRAQELVDKGEFKTFGEALKYARNFMDLSSDLPSADAFKAQVKGLTTLQCDAIRTLLVTAISRMQMKFGATGANSTGTYDPSQVPKELTPEQLRHLAAIFGVDVAAFS